ncbi:MAG: class I SAM-dependent methyltransferase [Pseudomonadota bacterium]
MQRQVCWCGGTLSEVFSPDYMQCNDCGTLVGISTLTRDELLVSNDETAFYGKNYWLQHQENDYGYPSIFERASSDLTDRNLHWLSTLLKYKLPPAKTLELGCSHGSFVGMLNMVGFDAEGMEMSPWVVDFAKETFDVPVLLGPLEDLEIQEGSYDVIALMDVLEHLPDPVGTMRKALSLLNQDGILLIQTPQFKPEMRYQALLDTDGPFLEQLKKDEHLFLFSTSSVTRLFAEIGAEHIVFEEAMFTKYDMFFVVSREPLTAVPDDAAEKALNTPKAKFVAALLSQDQKIKELQRRTVILDEDRQNRLDQIHELTDMVKKLQ